jgi:hypothetical protein
MKTWEALKAADEGKKIRRKCWMDDVYCFKGEPRGKPSLITHRGRKGFDSVIVEGLDWDDIFADDWEIYKEKENERTGKSFAK